MTQSEQIILEATIEKAATGKEWEVTIIGAQGPGDLLTVDGKRYVRSDNGRLYDVDALRDSATMWEGVKVYDNHLTEEEFHRKQGMRSPATEWLGTIVKPRWDEATSQLRGIFKVIETGLAAKLKAAHDQGILSTIGLSIDTFPIQGQDIYHEGQRLPVIGGFKMIRSVDLVAEPAAGGRFERLIAAKNIYKENDMSEETNEFADKISELENKVSALADALAAKEADKLDKMTDQQVIDAKTDKDLAEGKLEIQRISDAVEKTQLEAAMARTELAIEHRLKAAKLPEKFEETVRSLFEGRVVETEEIDKVIANLKAAQASVDPSGKVRAGGDAITVGIDSNDRMELEISRLLMGETDFRKLEHAEDETTRQRVHESQAYQSWLKAGKPDLPRYQRISSLIYDFHGGDPLIGNRAMEAATTATLTTAVKNTVNIMLANDYSQRELWFEPRRYPGPHLRR
jgi:hypothetical protein